MLRWRTNDDMQGKDRLFRMDKSLSLQPQTGHINLNYQQFSIASCSYPFLLIAQKYQSPHQPYYFHRECFHPPTEPRQVQSLIEEEQGVLQYLLPQR